MNQFLHGVARAVSETFDLPGPILEIGSFQVAGQEAIADLRSLFPGREYVGVDMRPGPGVDCVANVEALPYEDSSVGTVIALSTFEHVRRFWRGFEEIRRVLRPDGALLVSCPFFFHIHEYPCDYWRFTPAALEVLLEDYPHRIVGWHGAAKRPANVWALAFREQRAAITQAAFQHYRELLDRYARQPLSWGATSALSPWQRPLWPRPFRPRSRSSTMGDHMPDFKRDVGSQSPSCDASNSTVTSIPHSGTRQSSDAAPRKSGDFRYEPEAAWRRQFLDAGPIDVSVCIANWNCRDMLRTCLASLHDQSHGVRLETIVVDNASHDGAADMVEHAFPEVLLIRNDGNAGFSRANNQAARRAQGRYLFFLNNDTVVPPGTVGRLCSYLDAHGDVGMVGPRLRDARGNAQVSYRQQPTVATLLHRTALLRWTGLFRRSYRQYRRTQFDPHARREVDVLMGAAVMLPRERFLTWGGWDEDFTFGGEDLELSFRVNRQAKVIFLPDVEILHHGRASTRQHSHFAAPHIATGLAKYLRKSGCSPAGLLAYKVAVTIDAPLQLVGKGVHYLWRRITRRHAEAEKSLNALRGIQSFLRQGLPAFWRA